MMYTTNKSGRINALYRNGSHMNNTGRKFAARTEYEFQMWRFSSSNKSASHSDFKFGMEMLLAVDKVVCVLSSYDYENEMPFIFKP